MFDALWTKLPPDEPLQVAIEKLNQTKVKLDRARPLPPEAVRNLKEYFDIAWTHHSTAIEGNTLTESETRAVLLDGVTIAGKTLREHLEVVNHRAAIDHTEEMAKLRRPLDEGTIRELHHVVMRGIDETQAGRYRTIGVRIGGSEHLPPNPSEIPRLMATFVTWLEQGETMAVHEPEGLHPVILAGRAHHRFVYIHPFADGNGRTTRLLMNLILTRFGYPPAVIRLDERQRYYATLEMADRTFEDRPFLHLVAGAAQRSLEIVLQVIEGR